MASAVGIVHGEHVQGGRSVAASLALRRGLLEHRRRRVYGGGSAGPGKVRLPLTLGRPCKPSIPRTPSAGWIPDRCGSKAGGDVAALLLGLSRPQRTWVW